MILGARATHGLCLTSLRTCRSSMFSCTIDERAHLGDLPTQRRESVRRAHLYDHDGDTLLCDGRGSI